MPNRRQNNYQCWPKQGSRINTLLESTVLVLWKPQHASCDIKVCHMLRVHVNLNGFVLHMIATQYMYCQVIVVSAGVGQWQPGSSVCTKSQTSECWHKCCWRRWTHKCRLTSRSCRFYSCWSASRKNKLLFVSISDLFFYSKYKLWRFWGITGKFEHIMFVYVFESEVKN